jgi:phosphoglycerate dehydrogenase-like enzyme
MPRAPKVMVGPVPEPYAVAAVTAGGGEVVGEGDGAEGLVWLRWRPGSLPASGPQASPADLVGILDRNPAIRWVQLPMAGIEAVVESGVMSLPKLSRVTWTSAKGSYSRPVAEHALALALALLRKLPERARARSWGEPAGTTLYGAPVTILGGGGIAADLLGLLEPFGVEATVVRRTAEPVARASRTLLPGQLHEALGGALVVFVALALSPETVHVIGERELALMGPESYLVNVARGRHVDTSALVSALEDGRIGGAGLDVTDPEPLPDEHPLWSFPNCLITPHTADWEEIVQSLLAERIRENVERLATGLPLVGVVDPVAGY